MILLFIPFAHLRSGYTNGFEFFEMSEIQLVLKICKYSSFHFIIIESSLNVRSGFLYAWRPNPFANASGSRRWGR